MKVQEILISQFVSIELAIGATEVELLLEIYLHDRDSCTGQFCILGLQLDIPSRTFKGKCQESVRLVVGSCLNFALDNLVVLLAGKELPIPKEV